MNLSQLYSIKLEDAQALVSTSAAWVRDLRKRRTPNGKREFQPLIDSILRHARTPQLVCSLARMGRGKV